MRGALSTRILIFAEPARCASRPPVESVTEAEQAVKNYR